MNHLAEEAVKKFSPNGNEPQILRMTQIKRRDKHVRSLSMRPFVYLSVLICVIDDYLWLVF
jgi:hypothetical protein